MLAQLVESKFLILGPHFFFQPKSFGPDWFFNPTYFGPKIFWPKILTFFDRCQPSRWFSSMQHILSQSLGNVKARQGKVNTRSRQGWNKVKTRSGQVLGKVKRKEKNWDNTSLAAKGHSLTAYNAAPPAKSKMAARGPQNGRRGLERCLPLGFWAF